MHERIWLAIVANEETETLHGIEELDRSGRFLAGQLTLRRPARSRSRDDFTDNLEVLSGNLAAAIDEVEFELLPFCKSFEARAFDSTDMDENVLAAALLLDETEAFLAVEEFDGSLAGPDHLRGHAVETAAATAAARTTTAAAARPAAETATTAAAIAESITTAAAAAEAITATTEAVTTAIISEIPRGRKTIAAAEWIEAVFTESVPLVPTASTSPVVSHNSASTLSRCPTSKALETGATIRTRRNAAIGESKSAFPPRHIAHKGPLCE
jgi:hypothetical protein